MSSWIPSLFNPFSDDDNPKSPATSSSNETTPRSPSSGAKDDLSAVFRGVASFLAPPQAVSVAAPSSSETIAGIKNDLAEIQGSFRSGLSLISSRFTSNLLQFQNQLNDIDENNEVEEEEEDDDDDDEDGVGTDEEVLDFVWKISERPELWTDFPLSLPDDFDLSDYQREHAANIDHLVPDFVTLRQKICTQMSDGKFWLIYFILLLPRLNEVDSKLLMTPQVAEARETLMKKLQNKPDTDQDQETAISVDSSDTKEENGKEQSTEAGETTSQHKDVINPTNHRDVIIETESVHHSEEVDRCTSTDPQRQSENEEDVSFSDLEDDDNELSHKQSGPEVSKGDKVWVQLNESSEAKQKADQSPLRDKESEGEDSNDWLTVDDTDFDNLAGI